VKGEKVVEKIRNLEHDHGSQFTQFVNITHACVKPIEVGDKRKEVSKRSNYQKLKRIMTLGL
jgi:hypothetical protein